MCLDSLFGVCFGYRYVGAKRAVFRAMKSKAWNRLSRRDVPTSRRPHVATSQRRDVSSRSEPYHLKYGWLRLQRGDRKGTKRGTDFQSRVTQTSRECPGLYRFSFFLIFLDLSNDVFFIKNLHLLIRYDLDLFLGLY